jgi:hypothetical protein
MNIQTKQLLTHWQSLEKNDGLRPMQRIPQRVGQILVDAGKSRYAGIRLSPISARLGFCQNARSHESTFAPPDNFQEPSPASSNPPDRAFFV